MSRRIEVSFTIDKPEYDFEMEEIREWLKMKIGVSPSSYKGVLEHCEIEEFRPKDLRVKN